MSTKWRAPGDYVRDQAGAALGARLRRISDRIDREADALYQALHLDFEQRWFGIVNQLVLHQTRTVGEIAEALGVSHAAVSQVRSALAERGLIVAETDPEDARKRVLKLSAAGKRLAMELGPTWVALSDAARELDAEARGITRALERLEEALDRRSLTDRVQSRL